MYNNNIRTDSEIHQFINSEFRNDRLRLEWPLVKYQKQLQICKNEVCTNTYRIRLLLLLL